MQAPSHELDMATCLCDSNMTYLGWMCVSNSDLLVSSQLLYGFAYPENLFMLFFCAFNFLTVVTAMHRMDLGFYASLTSAVFSLDVEDRLGGIHR